MDKASAWHISPGVCFDLPHCITLLFSRFVSTFCPLAIELNRQFAESYKQRAVAYDKLKENEKAESDRQKYKELSETR